MLEHDVLVIGAGLAGMRAAIAARAGGATTAIISKVHPVRSHSNAAQGGINAALTDRGDDWEEHAYDTVKGSDYLGDQDAIEVMCKAAGQALIDMEHFGVTFNRDDEGKLGTRAFGGMRRARTFFVGDFTGQAMLHVMFEQLIKSGVRRYEEWFVSSLIIEDGQVCGVMALEIRTGQVYAIRAKTVIFCTGGFGRVFEPSTNALICTGDGTALAYNAGAELMDMEMVQYHPTTLAGSGVLISEAARGEGAYLLDKDGNRFMEKYAPNMMELASRDVVSRAEQTEIDAGNGVNGCVYGGNRLGANSLLDTLVFGERSGNHAAEASRSVDYVEFDVNQAVRNEEKRIQDLLDRPQNGDRIAAVRLGMGDSMNRNLAVYRNEEGMQETLGDLKELEKRFKTVPVDNKGKVFNTDLVFALELGFMLDCATPIAISALDRKDSRGAQARTDYPDRDDKNWMKHLVIKKGEVGPEITYAPVSITRWTPEERKY
ncbi:MAG: FAD-binding protein [Chloroflexi bacterium]|nr:FAD-binding protein [Chloroflexota bacterium]